MNILGIETSCDENSVAIVQDGRKLLSNVVYSQVDLHKIYGGVVPEVAARSHIEVMIPTVQEALDVARLQWKDIDAIAVTNGPGLGGSLLIGVLTARTLALIKNKPLYTVHHAMGHIYANFIDWTQNEKMKMANDGWLEPRFPIVALIVSGGHSHLLLLRNHFDYEILGQTRDDAVGEAFDKVAKVIGLPYPGGPSIERTALQGNPRAIRLPKAKMANKYDFSFSGLKTAVLRTVQDICGVSYDFPSFKLAERLTDAQRADIAASFQHVALEILVDKTVMAYAEFGTASVIIAGGVAANMELRQKLSAALPIKISYAPMSLCTDNGAMIAALGYYKSQISTPVDPLFLEVDPSLQM